MELKNLWKSFDGHKAVSGVSLHINRGEFFSLLGPSGCGKTSMLRLIAGFEQPDRGEIFLEGELQNHIPPYKRNIHLVFQHFALFPHLNVFENVAFGLRSKKLPEPEIKKRVLAGLELVRLSGFESRVVQTLSGGQKQRVALIRALVNKPRLLLLDEPLGALDFQLKQEMQLELIRVQREVGTTFVYVTHDQSEALTLSSRIAVMKDGQIEQVGTPEELYESPTSLFVAQFFGASNYLPATLLQKNGNLASVEVNGFGQLWGKPSTAVSGTEVGIVIRPERINFSPDTKSPPGNQVSGKVLERIFLGSQIQYRLAIGENFVISSLQPNMGGALYYPGDEVNAYWEAENTLILPRIIP